MNNKVYVGDSNTDILLDCGTDVSTALERYIDVKKPNGVTLTWSAFLSGTALIGYTCVSETFDMAGTWLLQSRIVLGQGIWRGETAVLTVYSPFG